jgi:hypothetical protein
VAPLRLVVTVAMLAGCAAEEVSTTTTTSAEIGASHVVRTDEAVERITREQCARVRACGAPESYGVYYGADHCTADVERETRDDLSGACDLIDAARVAACLDAVRHQPCAMLNATNHAPSPCRRDALCSARH